MAEKVNREMLIELVRNEPALWNKREKIYNNRDLKPDLWDKIGKSLNISGKVAQKSWETLRDSYRKIRKKVQSDISGRKDVSWPHYNAMCFLDDMLMLRETYPNSGFSPKREDDRCETCEREFGEEEEDNFYGKEMEDGRPEGKSNQTGRSQSENRGGRLKRKFVMGQEEEAIELEKRKIQISESRKVMNGQKLVVHESDDDYLFLMSLLPYLKKLDDVQKMRLRIEMLSSVTRELESRKYQDVFAASTWNPGAFAIPPRPASSGSSYSSQPTARIPTPTDEQIMESVARQRNAAFMTLQT